MIFVSFSRIYRIGVKLSFIHVPIHRPQIASAPALAPVVVAWRERSKAARSAVVNCRSHFSHSPLLCVVAAVK